MLRPFDATPENFLTTPCDEILRQRLAADPQSALVNLFRATVRDVPAYREFLAAHGVDPAGVDSYADFQRLPLTTKPNYMHAYPLAERCRQGRVESCERIAVSSGSTGTPTFWPRSLKDEYDVALRFEQVFRAFHAHERSTLAVVCFALGNWVGGMYTASCCWHLAQKGYPLMVATPGNNKQEIFRIVQALSPQFQQTVLLGYPPFVKDVIDAGLAAGVEWPRYGVKMVFAGEVFSEEWRTLVARRVGSPDLCYGSASLYGTADGGVLGNETPLSIAIRRYLAAHPEAARELFGEARLPTLVQYDPMSRYFEEHDGTLVVSGDNGVPLLRYHIADKGGIVSHARMMAFLAEQGADLADYGLDPAQPDSPLPFVYVFGRADFTVSYYGANIYPENVTVGLEQSDISAWASGKFVLETVEEAGGDKILRITVELLPGADADEAKAQRAADSIRRELLRLNSEFANYIPAERQTPHIVFRPFADPEYFPVGVKHRYTRKTP
ncbi:phenylacetate--CoA ligase family protein [Methylogaea oryzae]|uniref:Phenylacetate--CoA ligase n=1 Tax=Methylogaea oryzae TaxID=1295382 RepID=A0A8D5ALT4_9GAMM|nr:phenylacetate--CoA ligase family protein [Methylogaea oryzae]BBL70440.1 phenylacetate--CoA ligase [Methylogaea oryzae]